MPRDLIERLRRFQGEYYPRLAGEFRRLAEEGQRPGTLFIGCSDSRIVPHLLLDCGPGDLFIARNVGNFVPPYDTTKGVHETAAAIEFAVLGLGVSDIVICGHSHCGAIRALYEGLPYPSQHLEQWLKLARDAVIPGPANEERLRRTEQRSIVLQFERLMTYPMVRERVEREELFLHCWHYIIEEGTVLALDVASGTFVAARGGGETQPGSAADKGKELGQ